MGRFQANQICPVSRRTEVCDGGLVKDADERGPRSGPKRLQPAGRLEFTWLVVVRADAAHRRESAGKHFGRSRRSRPRLLERLENLFEIFDRHVPPLGYFARRYRLAPAGAGEMNQRP